MAWAIVDSATNTVENIIQYSPPFPTDSAAEKTRKTFIPPSGKLIREIADWIEIGDDADTLQP